MTDNEIIKAYGCCNLSHDECGGCDNCPCKIEGDCIVPSGFELEREVFNLLHRQQAEIERLECSAKDREDTARQLFISRENIKAEAVKEFAERLKKEIKDTRFAYEAEEQCECIDNLLEEYDIQLCDKNGDVQRL